MERVFIDHDLVRSRLAGICFICELVAGNPSHFHHVVFEDEETIAFLNKYPTVYGYVIVAPKRHREQVTGDFSESEYLKIQTVVHRVGEAIRKVVPTERLYVLSLGSQQANRHVHWHLAPLPPGVPFNKQQYRALSRSDYASSLQLESEEATSLAQRLREAINGRET
jgi:diadenosine tetraphosphate (Ap4A) HIT family hydrolase